MDKIIAYLDSREAIEIIEKYYYESFINKLEEIKNSLLSEEAKIDKVKVLVTNIIDWPWFYKKNIYKVKN